jgi:Dolichol kinase
MARDIAPKITHTMTTRDWIGLGLSYLYASGLLIFAELIRRWRGYPQEFTRKLVHIGAGMWVFGILGLFDTWYIGIIPFATFIGFNYLLWRYKLMASIDAPDSSPGTVYFALAITLLFLAFWRTGSPTDRGYIAAAGTMAMTWGDALASIVGKRYGRHHYRVAGSTRSYEGSAAMFVAAAIAMFLTILFLPGSSLAPLTPPVGVGAALVVAVAAAIAATLAEAISPAGTDNLSVPLVAAATVFVIVTTLA